jgi:cytochrome bd-type quinol oxidase subunit 1
MMLVTGGFTLALTLIFKLLVVVGKPELNEHLAVPYVLIHALGAVCTYKEWVPESFKQYPKDVMQW